MKKKFEEYLDLIEKTPDRFHEIEEEVWKKFGVNKVVLICDSTGFTQKTRDFGILHFLYSYHKVLSIVEPVVKKNRGKVIKTDADNLILVFDDIKDSANCSIEIQKKINSFRIDLPKKDQFGLCMGIATGKVLCFNNDVFGDAVNVAYKLGEDLAKDGEILVEEQIYEYLKTYLGYKFSKKIRKKISNIDINYFKVRY
ncbi:MAG TPA: adenylate/guanylate cyclase domain-containing protein [Firmicutes bacterium]|nr:adenylate/guanylate cyclase domain-containing protein [Bacillota bacterium]